MTSHIWQKLKKTIIWIIILAAVFGGGYYFLKNKKPQQSIVTETAKSADVIQTVSVTGELVPQESVDVSFKVAGKAVEVVKNVGDQVSAGELLAKVDPGVLKDELRQANADIDFQRQTYQNMLVRRNTYKKDQRDAQKALIEKSLAAKAAIETQIKDTSLYAPISGIIIKRNIEVGESALTTSSVFTISTGNDTLLVESNIPESDIVKVKVGQNAVLEFDSIGSEETFNAVVSEIEPASTVIQDVVYYKTKFKIDKIDERFRAGMSVDIDVHVAESKNVLAVPERAIRKDGKRKYVQVQTSPPDAKEFASKDVDVKTGLKGDDGMVEVISGLKEGDKVVVLVK